MRKGSGLVVKILVGAAVLLLAIQLIPVDRSNPPVGSTAMTLPGGDVGATLEAACMDCHSHETEWPWYSSVAPVSWWLADHVAEGREHLNFSTWGELAVDRQDHKLEELIEMVEDGEMPLKSYRLGHPEARIGDAQRAALVQWAREARAALASAGADVTAQDGG